MTSRLPPDQELTKTVLRDMPPSELRNAFEYLVAHAATLDGYECGAVQKGYFTDFRYYTPTEHPYAFIINKDSLRFYFRKPAGLRSPAANVDVLNDHFDHVEVTSGEEIAVQLRTLADAMALVHGVFGPGFEWTDSTPPIYTHAQMRVVAARMAGCYLHGTDDAPLMVAKDIAAYPAGQAAALSASIIEFLPDEAARTRFAGFLLDVSLGKVRSVFYGYRVPD